MSYSNTVSPLPGLPQTLDQALSVVTQGYDDPYTALISAGWNPSAQVIPGNLQPSISGSGTTTPSSRAVTTTPFGPPPAAVEQAIQDSLQSGQTNSPLLDQVIGGLLQSSLPPPPTATTLRDSLTGAVATYSGADMRVMLELPDPSGSNQVRHREFIELTTLSVSIYRVKAPARACGYINPKGFARGTRTIAGTMVMTQFTVDVLYRFLWNTVRGKDFSKDSHYVKPDQLPPFNLTMLFADEYGDKSWRRLTGVEMANDGTVYSTKDLYSEQTISYMASDFTPLLEVGVSANTNEVGPADKTPMQMLCRKSDLGNKIVVPNAKAGAVSPAFAALTSSGANSLKWDQLPGTWDGLQGLWDSIGKA